MSYRLDSPKLRRAEGRLDKCPRCGKGPFAEDVNSGELVCTNCGYVAKERVEETGPERRTFTEDGKDDNARTGSPASLASHDMGLATVIGRSNRDAAGSQLSGGMRSTVERMRTWDRRSQVTDSFDRNLRRAFDQLRTFAEKLSLSQEVIERAAYIYRKALDRDLLRGRSITQITAAALYAACRDMEVPRTLKDVAAVSNVAKKDVARSYRLLVKEIDLRMPVPDPVKSLSRIASKAGMSEKTKRRAFEILMKAQEKGVVAGKDPMGLAAAALYVANTLDGGTKTQKDVAQAAEVTEVTVRNRYKGLRQTLGI
jgi:transcription initiation factor TFIIB